MKEIRTNLDWPALVAGMPPHGPRGAALFSALVRAITSGGLAAGTRLPPSRDLAAQAGLSRGAVVAAYERLMAEGYAKARVGAGTFVAGAVPQVAARASVVVTQEPILALPGDLGLALPDPVSLAAFRRAVTRSLHRPPVAQFAYGDPAGDIGLRTEVARWLGLSRGVICTPGQVVMTQGTQGALDLIARAVLASGDAVWIEDPGYPSARAAFADQQLVPVPVDALGLDVAAGMRACRLARAAYVTPSHQFPLGVVMPMARRLALLDWARAAGAYVIEDDYDSEFRFAGPPLTALQGMDGGASVIYLGTFSKTFAPGLRMGFMVLPQALVGPVLAVRKRIDRYPPVLAEAAMAEMLRDGAFAAHLKRARRSLLAARDALVAELARAGHGVVAPAQGLHLVLALADGADDRAAALQARAFGFGARALSEMYLGDAPRRGLVLGYAGYPAERMALAARHWLAGAGL